MMRLGPRIWPYSNPEKMVIAGYDPDGSPLCVGIPYEMKAINPDASVNDRSLSSWSMTYHRQTKPPTPEIRHFFSLSAAEGYLGRRCVGIWFDCSMPIAAGVPILKNADGYPLSLFVPISFSAGMHSLRMVIKDGVGVLETVNLPTIYDRLRFMNAEQRKVYLSTAAGSLWADFSRTLDTLGVRVSDREKKSIMKGFSAFALPSRIRGISITPVGPGFSREEYAGAAARRSV